MKDCAPFERLLNMEIASAAKGRAVLRMPFFMAYAQGAGLMHGGALTALADTAAVMAIKSLLAPGTHFATISMSGRFRRPVHAGTVTATAAVARTGDSTFDSTVAVRDDAENTVMEFEAVFKVAKNGGQH